MKATNVDMVRKRFYETYAYFRGKGFTGAEVTMGVWEATSLNFLYDLLKKGYKIFSPSGIELSWIELDMVQRKMQTMALKDDDEKPDCFCTKKVRVRKGVPRYDCVLCIWELPCKEAYDKKRESIKRKRKKKKKRRSKN